jgi:5-methylcytosine-specific restriction endonuclease McrA
MAGDWIKMRCNLDTDPAVFQMAAALQIDELAVVGRLWKVWAWADQHTKDGSGIALGASAIDKLVACEGFTKAMRQVHWLNGEDGALSLPRFDRHNGETAKVRGTSAHRVAKHRAELAAGGKSFPAGLKRRIKTRDDSTCVYCGRKEGQIAPNEVVTDGYIHIDHVVPESRGGRTTEDNLVTSCGKCNKAKGARTPDEAGFKWPISVTGFRYGCNESLLQTNYQRREEKSIDSPPRAREETWEEPSSEQVVAAAERVGLTAEQAEIWRNDHLARPIAPDGRWTDRNGKPIGNWQHALAAWAGRWKQNERDKRGRGSASHNGSPKPAEGVWHLEKRIEAATKEIERIQSNPSNKEQVPDSFDRRLKPEQLAKVKALKASISEMRQRMAGVEVAA